MREIKALVTVDGVFAGSVPVFTVGSSWWADVEPVTAHLDHVLGVRTSVLRLVSTTGEGARDGLVTYQVEAHGTPDPGALSPEGAQDFPDTPLRLPWARPGGTTELLVWADNHVRRIGSPVQVKTWNLSCLYRIPTDAGTVWLKAIPPFTADEAVAIRMVARHDPDLVPEVLASAPGRLLLADVPGMDCWTPTERQIAEVVPRMVAVQAALAGPPELRVRPPKVEPAGGLPDTLLHGDFHPGNWRSTGVVLDWADAHWGHPALDAVRLCEFTEPELHPLIEDVWMRAWLEHLPASDPATALRLARPISHLVNAVKYQEFLDNIEDSERCYHEGDPEAEFALFSAG